MFTEISRERAALPPREPLQEFRGLPRDPCVDAELRVAHEAQRPRRMAAVLALVFLPVLASVALLVKVVVSGAAFGSVFALLCFSALAIGVFYGVFRMSRDWEGDHTHTT